MSTLNHILISIFSYIGIILGTILYKIAKEEVEDGINNLRIFGDIILGIIFLSLVISYHADIMIIGITTLFFIINTFLIRKYSQKQYFTYTVLGAVLYFSMIKTQIFGFNAFMIFLYGLSSGSLLKHIKIEEKEIILKTWYFLIIFIVLAFLI